MQTKDKLAKMEHVKIAHDHVDFTDRVKKGTGTGALVTGDIANNTSDGDYSFTEGSRTSASGGMSHAEGYGSSASGLRAHAEGYSTTASSGNAHAEGALTTASGASSHAEGQETVASGMFAHAEGYQSTASDDCAHAEGYKTKAKYASHAEGNETEATGSNSHAEGKKSKATGVISHAEGIGSTASGICSHAEGSYNTSSGEASHAEGSSTSASGTYSHSEGERTIAQRRSQHVFGAFNSVDTSGTGTNVKGAYVEIVGNGTADNARSNARTLDWSGNEVLAGKLTVGAGPTANMDVATKQYVDANAPEVMTGATYQADGTAGYVPAPPQYGQRKTLMGDGTWNTPYPSNIYGFSESGTSVDQYIYMICGDWAGSLRKGQILVVTFDSNIPANATLNLSDTGAIRIIRGAANQDQIIAGDIMAGDTVTFMYVETQGGSNVWKIISVYRPSAT